MLNFLKELFLFINLNLKQNENSSKLTSIVFGIIFSILMILLILELDWIFSLLSSVKFMVMFSIVGVLLGFIIYFFLLRLGIIKAEWKIIWTIVISCILLTVSLTSKFNRDGLPKQANERVLVTASPEFGETISRILIVIDDEIFELRTSIENGKQYQKGDFISIVNYHGKLGFLIIVKENNA